MGRIVSSVTINNISDSSKTLRCDALVDTGTSFLVLPDAWRDRLGDLEIIGRISLETATQESVEGDICGPVRIQIEGFRPIYNEVLFVEIKPEDGIYRALDWLHCLGAISGRSRYAGTSVNPDQAHGSKVPFRRAVQATVPRGA